MKILNRHSGVLSLASGVTLLASCLLFSGCNKLIWTKNLFGEEIDKFPSVVLKPQDHSTTYVFDWDMNTIGGVSLSEFKPKAKFWRLHLFKYSDGTRIGPAKTDWKPLATDRKETFENLKFDVLMQADLDLTDDPATGKNARTYSLNILLHDE